MENILVTGYSGFVGAPLVKALASVPYSLRLLGRQASDKGGFYRSDIDATSNYTEALHGVDVVIHCAARAHIMKDVVRDQLAEFRAINTLGTLNLAQQAADTVAKRFVFISTIKVNGESTTGADPFTDKDYVTPDDPYGVSKFEAEQGLLELARKSGMEVIIIRPPLVYGPSVKGNFSSIINLVKKNYPLPLASIIQNKRSLIALENLVDFILLCADYNKTPQAANQTFVISDGEDVSTAELFHRVAKAYGKKSRLFPFPVSLLRLGAKLLGKQDMADRLLGSLQVDSSKARELLGWKPVITMEEQLRKMAEVDSGEG
jgi:nucleoside-diphosphate-sugar epimerase